MTEAKQGLTELAATVVKFHIGMHQMRYKRIQQGNMRMLYFTSTYNRTMMSRVMLNAYYESKPMTVAEITKKIGTSRNAVVTMVDECMSEDWIEAPTKLKYQATYSHVKGFEEAFMSDYMENVVKTDIYKELLMFLVKQLDVKK